MRTWHARRMVVVLAAVAVLALGGSVVLAAIPSGGGMIYACYSKSTGAMRVVNYPTVRCASSERLLSWTQIGPKAPPLSSIGIQTVDLDPTVDYREPGGGSVLSVFVETGSSSNACLATLSELWWQVEPLANVGPLYCAARNPTIGGVVRHGVFLHLFFDGDVGAPAPGNPNYLRVLINVYQEGAKYYKPPVYCGPNCGE